MMATEAPFAAGARVVRSREIGGTRLRHGTVVAVTMPARRVDGTCGPACYAVRWDDAPGTTEHGYFAAGLAPEASPDTDHTP